MSDRQKAARIVRDAGGKLIGRTKFQKIAYFLELAGWGEGFSFHYHRYGPYSEALGEAIRQADVFGLIREDERIADWGGAYSVFTSALDEAPREDRSGFARMLAGCSSVELELAATAAFLHDREKNPDPWEETRRRKPLKARQDRLEKAQKLYESIRAYKTPNPLPQI